MAAKTPDNTEIVRIVQGSRTTFILDFSTTVLDDGDTVDVSNYLSVCEGAWFTPTSAVAQTSAPGIDISANTTLTMDVSNNGMKGKLFIVGTP